MRSLTTLCGDWPVVTGVTKCQRTSLIHSSVLTVVDSAAEKDVSKSPGDDGSTHVSIAAPNEP